jgi:hypothetical protein
MITKDRSAEDISYDIISEFSNCMKRPDSPKMKDADWQRLHDLQVAAIESVRRETD